jgi:hypothetical protein
VNVGFKGMLLMGGFLVGCGLDKSKLKLLKLLTFTFGLGMKALGLVLLFNWILLMTLKS